MHTRLLLVALGALAVSAAGAAAQTPSEPHLVLSLHGGIITGAASLWSIAKQPEAPIMGLNGASDTSQIDTVSLSRELATSLVLGGSGTYYPTPHLGIGLEMEFQGLIAEDHCQVTYNSVPAGLPNRIPEVCEYIGSHSTALTAVQFSAFGIYRLLPTASFTPYLRAGLGVASRSTSSVEMVGSFYDSASASTASVALVSDPNPGSVYPAASLAAGVMIPFSPAYGGRFEIRDQVMTVQVPDGPAGLTRVATKRTKWTHNFVITFVFDIVLEHRHGRRY